MMNDVILGLICFVLGFIFARWRITNKYYLGKMKVDYTDPMKDIYSMQVEDFNKIDKSKYVLFKVERTQKDNKVLLEKVINDRLNKALEDNDDTSTNFDEAMAAIDRQKDLDSDKRDKIIKLVEIGAAVIITPIIEAKCRKVFAEMICSFEKDYTFTTTAGKALSKLFRL